jgi:hypothetical protein
MQLPQRPAIELRHMEYGRADTKFGQNVRKAKKHSGNFPDAVVGRSQEMGYRQHGNPSKNLSRPLGSGGPRQPRGEPLIQIAAIAEVVRSHRRWLADERTGLTRMYGIRIVPPDSFPRWSPAADRREGPHLPFHHTQHPLSLDSPFHPRSADPHLADMLTNGCVIDSPPWLIPGLPVRGPNRT